MLRRAAAALIHRQPLSGRAFAEAAEVGLCSGMPAELKERRQVTLYSPARSSSQHAPNDGGTWKLAFGEEARCAPGREPCRINPTVFGSASVGLRCPRTAECVACSSATQVGEPADGLDVQR